tara:strand:+ start:49 stop:231 length:183 start_codon:yes stop_codon:yes gene_type:complete
MAAAAAAAVWPVMMQAAAVSLPGVAHALVALQTLQTQQVQAHPLQGLQPERGERCDARPG